MEEDCGFKIKGRNINNLHDADDTTLTVENVKDLQTLVVEVKEHSENMGLTCSSKQVKCLCVRLWFSFTMGN